MMAKRMNFFGFSFRLVEQVDDVRTYVNDHESASDSFDKAEVGAVITFDEARWVLDEKSYTRNRETKLRFMRVKPHPFRGSHP